MWITTCRTGRGAGLADELALHVLDALAHVSRRPLRPADVGIDLELAPHALDQHFQCSSPILK